MVYEFRPIERTFSETIKSPVIIGLNGEPEQHDFFGFGRGTVPKLLSLAAQRHVRTPCITKYLPGVSKSANAIGL